jgi:YegS/Rv2252/BmrU family lipid kinase
LSRFLVILNPAAGRGRARRAWPALAQALHGAGVAFDVVETRAAGEALELAARAGRECSALVAAGGDGTVHEVANGLMRAGARTPLGLLPLGSGDDFAKMLAPGDAVARLARRSVRAMDLGRLRCDGVTRWFVNGMDIGFGAHAARNVRRVPGLFTGRGAYLGALVLTLLHFPRLQVRLQLDDEPASLQSTTMTAVMNGRCFGGSFHVCPEARADDGLLDLLIAKGCGRREILALVPRIMRGTHAGDPRLRLTRARRVLIESDDPLLVEADGEIVFEDARRLEIDVLPGALGVLA